MKFLITFLIIPFIASCNSFNTLVLTTYELSTSTSHIASKVPHSDKEIPSVKKEVMVPPKEVIKYQVKHVCSKYQLPSLPETPRFPIQEMSSLHPTDEQAIDKLMMEYINKLHSHEKNLITTIRNSYTKYEKNCP